MASRNEAFMSCQKCSDAATFVCVANYSGTSGADPTGLSQATFLWTSSRPPPFSLNSICKRRPSVAVDRRMYGVLTLMKSIWVERVIYMSTSQYIIRINIIILLLPFLGFPLINQFSSIRLGWVLAAHRVECSALWEQKTIWRVQTMPPLFSDLLKAQVLLVLHVLVDVLQSRD